MEKTMKIQKYLQLATTALNRFAVESQSIILLLFRLTWGWQFFQTGWGKLAHHERTTEFFASLGIPAAALNAWFVGGLECFGGLLLLAGLASRPTAFLLAGNMVVAYLSVEEDRAAMFGVLSDLDPFLTAAPFFFLLTAALVFAFGPGRYSLDTLITTLRRRKSVAR